MGQSAVLDVPSNRQAKFVLSRIFRLEIKQKVYLSNEY